MHLDRVHHLRPTFLTWKWAKICAKMFHMLGLAHIRIGQTRIKNKTWRSALDHASNAGPMSIRRWHQRLVYSPLRHAQASVHQTWWCWSDRRRALVSVANGVSNFASRGDDRRGARLVNVGCGGFKRQTHLMVSKSTVGNSRYRTRGVRSSDRRWMSHLLQWRQMRLVTPRVGITALFEGVRLYICVGRL
jgi:hypothetical protein